MKSKRAKEHIMCHTMGYDCTTIQRDSVMLHKEYAEHAVTLAEQDAEERAVKAANELYEDLEPIFLHPMKREWLIDKFNEFYNNGGQSDE